MKIRFDRGTKFVNKVIKAYCEDNDILHQLSTAGTPQQNGVAKRRNRTLKEVTRTMISEGWITEKVLGRSHKYYMLYTK